MNEYRIETRRLTGFYDPTGKAVFEHDVIQYQAHPDSQHEFEMLEVVYDEELRRFVCVNPGAPEWRPTLYVMLATGGYVVGNTLDGFEMK